ncbi:MAG: ribose-5-phosphate isomerase RpiA [Chloroflexi bacterium]|jgi:ribose 5-phosphate isomerase A|nr:ribose-5-phosphate isomerase RpiA [Chloroflexota bacterium]
MTVDIDELKRLAAATAVDAVKSGMIVGLGTGSTALLMVQELGQRLQKGRLNNIVGIPTSEQSARQAQSLGIPLTTLSEQPTLDVTIDGADEIDPQLDLIKGLGGSLLREKIVASSSLRFIIIGDQRKLVHRLGTRAPLPVEVIPFAQRPVSDFLRALGSQPVIRENDGETFITDEGNIILDCHFAEIANPRQLALEVKAYPGVVEHGFFLAMATEAIVATSTGIKHFKRE